MPNAKYLMIFVENRYFIAFKEPKEFEQPLIEKPDLSRKDKPGFVPVPFGESSTGQSKEALAAELGLKGEILSIYGTMNTIYVEMDAERWRQDERVLYVEQDMYATAFGGTQENSGNNPFYDNGILTIPRVDSAGQPGLYQDAVFQFDEQTGDWYLLDVKTRETPQIFFNDGDGVETIITDTVPVQVFLKVKGTLGTCAELGEVSQRLRNNRFEVVIDTLPHDVTMACGMAMMPFETIVPLPVYGLSAGTYEYSLNGEVTGSFNLEADNRLPTSF